MWFRFELEVDPLRKPERKPEVVMRAMDGINIVVKERVAT